MLTLSGAAASSLSQLNNPEVNSSKTIMIILNNLLR
jgi:hypothetical protein